MQSLFSWLYGRPYLLLSLSALMWGGNAIAGKIAVGDVSPLLLTFLRWTVAMAAIAPFAIPHLARDWPAIRGRLAFLIAMGATGFTLFNNLMYTALTYTSAINVSILQASTPLMVFGLNFLLFRIRVTALQAFGYALTLTGVLLIAAAGSLEQLSSLAFNWGDLLILLAALTYGAYSVMLARKPAMHWLSFIFILGMSALATSLPFALWEAWSDATVWNWTTGSAVVIYTAIFPSVFAQVFWMRGLELIGSNRGGLFINLVPVAGTFLAILILGERLEIFHLAALLLVSGGVAIAQRRP